MTSAFFPTAMRNGRQPSGPRSTDGLALPHQLQFSNISSDTIVPRPVAQTPGLPEP